MIRILKFPQSWRKGEFLPSSMSLFRQGVHHCQGDYEHLWWKAQCGREELSHRTLVDAMQVEYFNRELLA